MPVTFPGIPVATSAMVARGAHLRHACGNGGSVWLPRLLAFQSGPILHPVLTSSPRRLNRGVVRIQTGTRPDTPGTIHRGLASSSPRRLPGGRARIQTAHGVTQGAIALEGLFTRSPRRLPPGSVRTSRWPAPPGTQATPLRGLSVRSPRRLPPGRAVLPDVSHAPSAILPRHGFISSSPRRLNRGRVFLPCGLTPPIVFGAGTPIHGLRVASPRVLFPGWAKSPHTCRQNPAPPPTFLTPLHWSPARAATQLRRGWGRLTRMTRPDTAGTPIHGLVVRGGRYRQLGRVRVPRATTVFLNTPLEGLQIAGKRPWHAGRVVVQHRLPPQLVAGNVLAYVRARSPRRFTPGRASTPEALPRIQPYASLRGMIVSSRRPVHGGRVHRPPFRPPPSTPGMVLHWSQVRSPRSGRAGSVRVVSRGAVPVLPPVPGTPIRGLKAIGQRIVRPGRSWLASIVPHAGSGFPLRIQRTSSPRRLTPGRSLCQRLRLGTPPVALPPMKVSRPPVVRPGKSVRLNAPPAAPTIGQLAGISRPRQLPVAPRLRRGSVLIQAGPRIATPIVPTAGAFREAVAAMVNAASGITSLIGSRIYWDHLSQLAVYPCLTISVKSREWGHNLPGADGTSTAQVIFSSIGLQESDVVALTKAVRATFDTFTGTVLGVTFKRTFVSDERDSTTPPPDGSDRWLYTITSTYEIVHYVPPPTAVTQTDV